jgi:hypothetical protein
MKSSTPNNDKIKETDPIIRCSRLEKASSKMPNSIVTATYVLMLLAVKGISLLNSR